MGKMKLCWQSKGNVICLGKIFKDGFGAIILFEGMTKPWIWKVSV